MDTRKGPLRPMSLGRTVHHSGSDKPLPPVPERVPEHPVAPNGDGHPKDGGPDRAHEDVLNIALVVPLRRYVETTKAIEKGLIRIVMPTGWGGEVILSVLPDLGEDLVDFDQYERPTVNLTLLRGLPE